jgi:16S rRNA (cytosine967-C5)-methyltransferase
MKAFRKIHTLNILNTYDLERGPLDRFLSDYFRLHKSIGSKDRGEIAETIYEIYRSFGVVNALSRYPLTWENRLDAFLDETIKEKLPSLGLEVRANVPKDLFDKLKAFYGEKKALEICQILNTRPPITIRANLAKTTRSALKEALIEFGPYESSTCDTALHLPARQNLMSHPLFQEGHFEMQDEASQMAAKLVAPGANSQILDYCAGSGGKSLAFAPLMQGRGQLYLHDIREEALLQAKKRLKRSGIQNAQIVFASSPILNKLKGKMDIVFVDAPCSGTGVYRRNPEQKWRFSLKMLSELIEKQRQIIKEACSYLKPRGTLIYATCSILKEENEEQIAFFEKNFGLKVKSPPLSFIPTKGGPDGFFAVCLCID